MGYTRANPLNAQRQATLGQQQQKKEDKIERYRPKEGMNILMIVPSLSETSALPYRHIHVHYNPFHLCTRPDPVEDAEGNVTIDKRFGPCPRCQGSWDAIEKEGFKGLDYEKMPDGPDRKRYGFLRSQRAVHQILWQVIDMTGFFTVKEVRKAFKVEVNPEMVAHMDLFADVIAGKKSADLLPEPLQASGKFGVSRIAVSKTAGNKMREAYYDRYMALDEQDPLVMTEVPQLMKVILAPGDKKMKLESGEKTINEWTCLFTSDAEVRGLTLSDKLIDAVQKKSIDLYSEAPVEETMAAYNDVFAKPPSKEVLLKWLLADGWTLGDSVEGGADEQEEAAPDLGFSAPQKGSFTPGSALGKYQNRKAAAFDEDDIPY